jgi:hypothetical protein
MSPIRVRSAKPSLCARRAVLVRKVADALGKPYRMFATGFKSEERLGTFPCYLRETIYVVSRKAPFF